KRYSDGSSAYETSYTIPNFNNSFIDITLNYEADFDNFFDRYFAIQRDFYSPLTRWAGGVFVQQRSLERPLPDKDWKFDDQYFRYIYQDYWGGHAFPISGSLAKDWSTNLVLGLRAFFLNYEKQPDQEYDPINYFSDERFYLGSVGLVSREYV